MKKLDTRRILFLSDMHIPFHHSDSLKFIDKLVKKYKPTLVISGGDLVDGAAIKYHEINPELPSAGDELIQVRSYLKQLYKRFPSLIIIRGNHDILSERKAITAGIPSQYMKALPDVWQTPKWQMYDNLTLTLPNGEKVFVTHGMMRNGLSLTKMYGVSTVQFHYHLVSGINYIATPEHLLWSMQCGCLVDNRSLAMAYMKNIAGKPVISTGLIINSKPIIETMDL